MYRSGKLDNENKVKEEDEEEEETTDEESAPELEQSTSRKPVVTFGVDDC